jgi:hypothetical protein
MAHSSWDMLTSSVRIARKHNIIHYEKPVVLHNFQTATQNNTSKAIDSGIIDKCRHHPYCIKPLVNGLSDDDGQVSHILWRPNRNLCLVKCNGLINEDAVTKFKFYLRNEKLEFTCSISDVEQKIKFLKQWCSDLWSKFSTKENCSQIRSEWLTERIKFTENVKGNVTCMVGISIIHKWKDPEMQPNDWSCWFMYFIALLVTCEKYSFGSVVKWRIYLPGCLKPKKCRVTWAAQFVELVSNKTSNLLLIREKKTFYRPYIPSV